MFKQQSKRIVVLLLTIYLVENMLFNTVAKYHVLRPIDDLSETEAKRKETESLKWRLKAWLPKCLCIVGISLLSLALWIEIWRNVDESDDQSRRVAIRKEWRTLERPKQESYIDSLQCLRRLPSRLGMNQTLYDDFPWIHALIGQHSHKTASFLPWHRYFLHVYEETLKTQCGYTGDLPYWNWSLDSHNIASSPIWSNETGFGGDGKGENYDGFQYGKCVEDGPMAGLIALFKDPFQSERDPHCFSRSFRTGETLHCLEGNLNSVSIDAVMESTSYEEFFENLEAGPHLAIPLIIGGDFHFYTVAYDPVFFLHHANVDRLWRNWQLADPETRLYEFNGLRDRRTNNLADIEDVISVGGLAIDRRVSELMTTESKLLSYRY